MTKTTTTIFATTFEEDTYKGLTASPKYLLSKYIYDEKGDKLFQDIMHMPEYYLTNCEYAIFKKYTAEIATIFSGEEQGFDLIELGAGDGKKTKILLKHLIELEQNFTYIPIDISQNAIDGLVKNLSKEFPELKVEGEKGEYFEVLENLKTYKSRKKVVLVLGSNIGNLLHPKAIEFLTKLNQSLHKQDLLFIGFDQKKHPQTILNAYNDTTGITEAFNKNHLARINKELGGNFNLNAFIHWEVYDPESGTAKSYLVATEDQEVKIIKLNLHIKFAQWETIHTEISQKYDDTIVKWLANEAGLAIETAFSDEKNYYKNYIFSKKQK
ncbi:MAG: L-histidine N(alpha)-methyltransferase [Bacteroidetes bacterium HGW-Bacteroidetes-2]|jgi:dimethylhistidine N-methyltransferase|nr:MAG: L-histidine N(alpha)-methyltransferase [Bacteroidetes bacterium HGW-Bacteroidetes-2]